ncbi:hypothetical protein, partial [Acetatifactor aquisgranensis]|uniref:hypothetical protein n=1 Tax=Acetatifactor aquisgranensis TaxID=2941233 RepID=UPI00203AF361
HLPPGLDALNILARRTQGIFHNGGGHNVKGTGLSGFYSLFPLFVALYDTSGYCLNIGIHPFQPLPPYSS